jgi:phage repressor protein C with HTH and peptisase S24 domain
MENEKRAARLREARAKAGYENAADAVRAFGWTESTYFAHENASRGLRADVARRYAGAFHVSSAWLLYGDVTPETAEPVPVSRQVPVVGEVRAGAWAEVREDVVEFEVPVSLPAYERSRLFALRVIGRSMDREYPEGTIVIVCPAAEAGVHVGDHVVVRRYRAGMAETTVKEVEATADGEILLIPKSTDPAHQEPMRYAANRDENSQEGIEIIGVVVSSQRDRERGRGPMIDF